MQRYFPYSHIIGVCNHIRQNIGKCAYFSEWIVCDSDKSEKPKPRQAEISEIYY